MIELTVVLDLSGYKSNNIYVLHLLYDVIQHLCFNFNYNLAFVELDDLLDDIIIKINPWLYDRFNIQTTVIADILIVEVLV